MKKLLIVTIQLFLLSGCSWFHVHKMDVDQGNIMTQDQIHRLHVGMTEAQVKNLMGNPVLITTFNDHRLNYIYTFKPGYGTFTEKYVILTFKKGVVTDIRQAQHINNK